MRWQEKFSIKSGTNYYIFPIVLFVGGKNQDARATCAHFSNYICNCFSTSAVILCVSCTKLASEDFFCVSIKGYLRWWMFCNAWFRIDWSLLVFNKMHVHSVHWFNACRIMWYNFFGWLKTASGLFYGLISNGAIESLVLCDAGCAPDFISALTHHWSSCL